MWRYLITAGLIIGSFSYGYTYNKGWKNTGCEYVNVMGYHKQKEYVLVKCSVESREELKDVEIARTGSQLR